MVPIDDGLGLGLGLGTGIGIPITRRTESLLLYLLCCPCAGSRLVVWISSCRFGVDETNNKGLTFIT